MNTTHRNNPRSSRWPQAALNVAALAVMLTLNTLATTLPLGGRTTAEISDSFNLRFVPAGYVFAIWGLIYLALIGFTLYQALPAQQSNSAVRATGYWFALSSAANAAWIVAWHTGHFTLTVALMLTLLASLIVIYSRLAALPPGSAASRWLVRLPFSLYLGWITVATVANVSAWLVDLGWGGQPFNPVVWTVILVAVATGLGLALLMRHRDLVYAGVLVWALVGILLKQSDSMPIVTVSALAVAALAAGAVAAVIRRPAQPIS
jgi:hypothetical protein